VKHWIFLLLLAGAARAQTTTVQGTITDPAGDKVNGTCSIQAVAPFSARTGWRIVGAPMVVPFTAGAFSAALVPTDTATPQGQYYQVECAVPSQTTANGYTVGPFSWGPRYWLVPTSSTALDISAVEVTSGPASPNWTILPQQIQAGGLTPGVYCWNVTTTGFFSSLGLCSTVLAPLLQTHIPTGTAAQYFRGDFSLATFPTTWPWANITGAPTLTNTVFGRSGAVTAQTGDYTSDQVTEGATNLYFTNARAQTALAGLYQTPITLGAAGQYFRGDLSLATFPTTWAWSALTGVPTLVNSFGGRSGAVTPQAGDYTTTLVAEGANLYFTNARALAAMAGLYQSPIALGTTAQYFRGDLSLGTFPTTWAWANLSGIPTLTNTVFGRSGAVTAQAGDYSGIYEPVLGNPSLSGQVLSSTTGGARSWITPVSLSSAQSWTALQIFGAGVSHPTATISSTYSAGGTPIPACSSSNLMQEAGVTDAKFLSGAYATGGNYTVPVRCTYNAATLSYTWIVALAGTPGVVAKADATAQTGSIGWTSFYTTPANGAGMYRMDCYVVITQAATTSATFPGCQYYRTDMDTNATVYGQFTFTGTYNNAPGGNSGAEGATGYAMGSVVFMAAANSQIYYGTTGYASVGATPMQYAVHVKLEYLGN